MTAFDGRRFFRVGSYASTRPELEARKAAHDLREGEILFLTDEDRVVGATASNGSEDAMMRHDTGAEGHKLPWLDGANSWSETQQSAGGWLTDGPDGIGYLAGGSAAQTVSKAQAVTCHALAGQITTHDGGMAAGGAVSFDVLNNAVRAKDSVILNMASGAADPLAYWFAVVEVVDGRFTIGLRNMTNGVDAIAEALGFNFAIVRGGAPA